MQKRKVFFAIILIISLLCAIGLVYWSKNDSSLNQNQNIGCQYWQKDRPYQGKAELIDLNKIAGFKDDYKSFQAYTFSFDYPDDWIPVVMYKDVQDGEMIISFKEEQNPNVTLSLANDHDRRFLDMYSQCTEGCIKNCSSQFCSSYYFCAESYSKENLNKILTGGYINYLNSGPRPPGGTSRYSLDRVFDDQAISVYFDSEGLIDGGLDFDKLFKQATYILKSIKVKD